DGYLIKPASRETLMRELAGEPVEPIDEEHGPADGDAATTGLRAPAEDPLTVLLAEDNEINALLATAVLEREGHRVHRVANGALAVDRVAEMLSASTPPDLVLMDMQMSEMDGIEATRLIRACEARHGGRR